MVDATNKEIDGRNEMVQRDDLEMTLIDSEVQMKNKKNEEKKGSNNMEKVMVVEGMACGHCKANVEKTLMALDGVTAAVVDLEKKEAVVTLDQEVSNEVLTNAVTEAGYTVVSCQ